jgi:hypothetical protein
MDEKQITFPLSDEEYSALSVIVECWNEENGNEFSVADFMAYIARNVIRVKTQ